MAPLTDCWFVSGICWSWPVKTKILEITGSCKPWFTCYFHPTNLHSVTSSRQVFINECNSWCNAKSFTNSSKIVFSCCSLWQLWQICQMIPSNYWLWHWLFHVYGYDSCVVANLPIATFQTTDCDTDFFMLLAKTVVLWQICQMIPSNYWLWHWLFHVVGYDSGVVANLPNDTFKLMTVTLTFSCCWLWQLSCGKFAKLYLTLTFSYCWLWRPRAPRLSPRCCWHSAGTAQGRCHRWGGQQWAGLTPGSRWPQSPAEAATDR